MAFVGAACAGALLAILIAGRDRLRGRGRLLIFGLFTAASLAGGAALVRPEARGVVTLFALVPLGAGFVLTVVDLRRGRRGLTA